MLIEKYMPEYHFAEKHSILIKQSPQHIWPIIDQMDMSGSRIIRFLFALRGMPARMTSLEGLSKERFIRLEQKQNEDLVIGLIGQFWKPSGNLQLFSPPDFTNWNHEGFCKGTWDFTIRPQGDYSLVETETRVFCTNEKTRQQFSRYWFFIRPFSGLIRKEILKGLKKKAESF